MFGDCREEETVVFCHIGYVPATYYRAGNWTSWLDWIVAWKSTFLQIYEGIQELFLKELHKPLQHGEITHQEIALLHCWINVHVASWPCSSIAFVDFFCQVFCTVLHGQWILELHLSVEEEVLYAYASISYLCWWVVESPQLCCLFALYSWTYNCQSKYFIGIL